MMIRSAENPGDFALLERAYPSDPYSLMIRKDDPQFKALDAEFSFNVSRQLRPRLRRNPARKLSLLHGPAASHHANSSAQK